MKNVSKFCAIQDSGSSEHQYESERPTACRSGTSIKRFRGKKFKSTLSCKAGSVSMMHMWAGITGDHFTGPCVLPAKLTGLRYL